MVIFTNWTGVHICVKLVFIYCIFTYLCKTSVPWITKGLAFIHITWGAGGEEGYGGTWAHGGARGDV